MEKKIYIRAVFLFIVIVFAAYFSTEYFLFLDPPLNFDENLTEFSAHKKEYIITLNANEATVSENLNWAIGFTEENLFFSPGKWGIEIPQGAYSIRVRDNHGDIAHTIRKNTNNNQKMVVFKNTENIGFDSDFEFHIQYTLSNSLVVYEPYYFFSQTFKRFTTDEEFLITIKIPAGAEIISLSRRPIRQYPDGETLIQEFTLEKGETDTINIEFKLPGRSLELTEIHSRRYTALVSQRYSSAYQEILYAADDAVEKMEELYGYDLPFPLSVEIINYEDNDFEEHTEGFFLGESNGGGRIRIKATQFFKSREEVLYILLHETAHAFNYKYFGDDVPVNFWLEEGLAQFVPWRSMEDLDYTTASLRKQNEELIHACENNTDTSFITMWRPNIFFQQEYDEKIQCNGLTTNIIDFGYAQSYYILTTIIRNYGIETIKDFFVVAENHDIEFASDHPTLNNQINVVLSHAVGQDTTALLKSLGLQVKPLEEARKTITGLSIFEEETEINSTVLIFIVIIVLISLLVLAIMRKRKHLAF